MGISVTSAEEKIKGRKRRIVTGAMGNPLSVIARAVNIHDTASGYFPAMSSSAKYPSITSIIGIGDDSGYRETLAEEAEGFLAGKVDITPRKRGGARSVLPKRRAVRVHLHG